MDSAIRDVYSDLRNVGDPALILDNYLLLGIPPLASPNPAVQVSLSYAGYFNGFSWSDQRALPISCERVKKISERFSGTQATLLQLLPPRFGTGSKPNRSAWACGDARKRGMDAGCLSQVDLRIRCRITFPDFLDPATINFSYRLRPDFNLRMP